MYPMDKTVYNLLLKNYPQYRVLREELLKLFYREALHRNSVIDCYVNVNSYISSIYNREDCIYDDPNSITSSLINFVAHIREFFASRFSIGTRFFLIYGNNRPDSSSSYIAEYDAHNEMERKKNPYLCSKIAEDIQLLNVIIQYIPEAYLISDQNTEPAVLAREMIKYQSSIGFKYPRLIFSKDLYDYQLVATCPNTHLIRSKKTMQGDKTYTVSYFDFYKKLSKSLSLKNPIGEGVSPELYSLYMSMSGCRDRGVRSIISYPNSDKRIKRSITICSIVNGHNIMPALDPITFSNSIGLDPDIGIEVSNRFKALDIIYQSNLYKETPGFHNITKSLVDLYDADGVRVLNNTRFKKYPLDLNVL